MSKYQNYIYVNLRNVEVRKFRGQFKNVPEALEYASKKYIEDADKPSLRGYMVLLNGNGTPLYPVGYKHPRIPSIAMSRNVDITKAQFYFNSVKRIHTCDGCGLEVVGKLNHIPDTWASISYQPLTGLIPKLYCGTCADSEIVI